MSLKLFEPSEGEVFVNLLSGARAALDFDIDAARDCLDRLAELTRTRPRPTMAYDAHPAAERRPPVQGGLASWQLRQIASYVDANIHAAINIADLATVARLSNGYLGRAFKKTTGETPHGFVVRHRIAHAKKLMLTTSDTLSEIACACGFSDQAHLTRLFGRFVGSTPLVWRRTWLQGSQIGAAAPKRRGNA